MALANIPVLRKFAETVYEREYKGDPCTKEGADKLEEKIVAYWRERGYAPPQFKRIDAGFVAAMRSARVDLRSDMVNGKPRFRALPSPEDK